MARDGRKLMALGKLEAEPVHEVWATRGARLPRGFWARQTAFRRRSGSTAGRFGAVHRVLNREKTATSSRTTPPPSCARSYAPTTWRTSTGASPR